MDYVDELSRLGLSEQQASLLVELYQAGPNQVHAWEARPRSRAESVSNDRMLHDLKDAGYLRLMARPGQTQFTHLLLTDEGRDIARTLEAKQVVYARKVEDPESSEAPAEQHEDGDRRRRRPVAGGRGAA